MPAKQNAFEVPIQQLTGVEAAAEMTDKNALFVKFDTDGYIVVAGAGENAVGVLQSARVLAKTACPVLWQGQAIIKVGGANLKSGDAVSSDANGKAVKATTGTVLGFMARPALANSLGTVALTLSPKAS